MAKSDYSNNTTTFDYKIYNSKNFDTNNTVLLSNLKAGFTAGLINGILFHPPKTLIKYQYVNGTGLSETLSLLLFESVDNQRVLRGIFPNIIKYSCGKMGEASIYTYFKQLNFDSHNTHEFNARLYFTSLTITLWRVNLMPLDTISNVLQVHGKNGYKLINTRIKNEGIKTLYSGSIFYGAIIYIHSFIWFSLYESLSSHMITSTQVESKQTSQFNKSNIISNTNLNIKNDLNNGIIGFLATLGSDTINNPLKVIKTYKQTYKNNISYFDSFKHVISGNDYKKGIYRGLYTKTILNAFTSSIYVILWKRFESLY